MLSGECGEAQYEFYSDRTHPPRTETEEKLCASLIAWYERNRNEGEKLRRMKRIYYNDLLTKAWK